MYVTLYTLIITAIIGVSLYAIYDGIKAALDDEEYWKDY